MRLNVDADQVVGVREARADGFVPIEDLMGETEFGQAFPDDHVRSVTDTRYEPDPDDLPHIPGMTDGQPFLVRSPWPTLDLTTVISLMWRWLRRNEHLYLEPISEGAAKIDTAARFRLVEQFLRQTEAWARAYKQGHVRPTR